MNARVFVAVLVLALVGALLIASEASSARLPKPKPWKVVHVLDKAEGWNYLAIFTDRRNAIATGRFLIARGTWRDVRRLFNSSFALDARYSVGVRRLGRLILRAAARGRWVVYRSENGGYPFAPFAPEPSGTKP